MRAGQLNQRVTVQRPVRSTDEIGGVRIAWETVAETWCSVWPVSGVENLKGAAVQGVVSHEVRMRKQAVPELGADYRLSMAGRTFELTGPPLNVEERGERWRCLVIERPAP